MRILSCYYTHKPGGFCKRLYRLLEAASRAGHEVHYATLDQAPIQANSNFHLHRIPFPIERRRGLLFWLLFTIWTPLYLAYLARRVRPQRLLAFGAFYASLLSLTSGFFRAPTVLFLRSLVFRINEVNAQPWILRKLSNCIDRFGVYRSARVVCMTQSMRDELVSFLGYAPSNIEVLANDVPPAPSPITPLDLGAGEAKVGKNTLIAITSGVLDKRKNVELAIQACAAFSKDSDPQDIILLVAGEGPEKSRYEALCQQNGVKNIIFLGWRESLWPLYARAHLVIHPALHEGMSNSLLEALSYGLAILAANTKENAELLQEQQMLFAVDNPKALEERLRSFMHAPLQREQLSLHSKQIAKRYMFDWDSAAITLIATGSF